MESDSVNHFKKVEKELSLRRKIYARTAQLYLKDDYDGFITTS